MTLLKLCRRLVQATALLALSALLVMQVYKVLAFYFDEPTYFSSAVVRQKKAAFPAMTVCPEGGGYKKEVLQVCHNLFLCTQISQCQVK